MLDLMAWWDEHKLGNWSITGPASGWNAMRHRNDSPRLVIDSEHDATVFERSCIYGGRREVYEVGTLPSGRYVDYDIHAAYPHVAATKPLPRARVGRFNSLTIDQFMHLPDDIGVIANVFVRNAGGHVPVRIAGEVWYPRGNVLTVLASPEIRLAIDSGCSVQIGSGSLYSLTRRFSGWARWIIGLIDGTDQDTPAVARVWAKHMSRAVIGKTAAHSSRIEKVGKAPSLSWQVEQGWNYTAKVNFTQVDIAGTRYRIYPDGDSENALPAVFAFVESYTRVLIDTLIRDVPGGTVVQCDTDGILMRENVPVDVPKWAAKLLGIDLRVKMVAEHVEIIGPQHLILDKVRRLSGVPKAADRVDATTFSGRSWPGIAWQLSQGTSTGYVRPKLTTEIRGPYCHRWVMADGSTVAPTAIVRDNTTTVLPWRPVASGDASDGLAPVQHKYLAAMVSARPAV
jgi:hypothetical protein